MKTLPEIILPYDRKYTDEHVWAKTDGIEIIVGISDFAQDQLGEIVYVDLPTAGDHFAAEDGFGTVESIKSVNTLYMPVSGTVTAVNQNLETNPTLINTDCYDQAWMIRIKPDSDTTLDSLLAAEEYLTILKQKI